MLRSPKHDPIMMMRPPSPMCFSIRALGVGDGDTGTVCCEPPGDCREFRLFYCPGRVPLLTPVCWLLIKNSVLANLFA
jgi:hypothetical protein